MLINPDIECNVCVKPDNYLHATANVIRSLREALLTFVHGLELGFLLLLLLRIIIDFCEGTMNPRHMVLSTGTSGSLKTRF